MTATQGRREYRWRIIVNSKVWHSGEAIWPFLFNSELEARAYANGAFVEGAVLRFERVDVTERKVGE